MYSPIVFAIALLLVGIMLNLSHNNKSETPRNR